MQVKLEAVDKCIEIGNILNFHSWMSDHSSLFYLNMIWSILTFDWESKQPVP